MFSPQGLQLIASFCCCSSLVFGCGKFSFGCGEPLLELIGLGCVGLSLLAHRSQVAVSRLELAFKISDLGGLGTQVRNFGFERLYFASLVTEVNNLRFEAADLVCFSRQTGDFGLQRVSFSGLCLQANNLVLQVRNTLCFRFELTNLGLHLRDFCCPNLGRFKLFLKLANPSL